MHIEIGILTPEKITFASVTATALLGTHAMSLMKSPSALLRTPLAALFFSVLMQVWHMPVGPSELHFVGAMPIYLLFGFLPTLFGFGLGLLLQALLFEPQDLMHLPINFLSLAIPLLILHHMKAKKIPVMSISEVFKLDGIYYAGVTLMVGFWLSIGSVSQPIASWAMFAVSYTSLIVIEPFLTIYLVLLLRRARNSRIATLCIDARVLGNAVAK
jgi:cobalt/nickel transport system permease protein